MFSIGAWRAWPYNLRALGGSPSMFSTDVSQALPILFYLLGFMRRLRFGARILEGASDLSDSTSTNQIARIKHDAVSTNHMHTGCRRKYSVFR